MPPNEHGAVHQDAPVIDLFRSKLPLPAERRPSPSPSRAILESRQTLASYIDRFCISPSLSFPLAAGTRTFLVATRGGATKPHPAVVLVEEMVADRLPVVILDSTGSWHALRRTTNGAAEGLPVHVLGGLHGALDLRDDA